MTHKPQRFLCTLSALLMLSSLTLNASDKKGKQAHQEPALEYRIGADDVLNINVWHEAELSKTVPVRPDGKISLPLVGEFQASGKTPAALQAALKTEFAKYINAPDVTVIVTEIKSQKINVMGEVEKPGSFPYTSPMSALDAMALAGGAKDFAKTKKIYILRRSVEGQTARIPFHYKAAMRGDAQQDVQLNPGDTLVVP
jgi:polysaccharide biosynthesis/export protein